MPNKDLKEDMRRLKEKYEGDEGIVGYRHWDPDVIRLERKHGKKIEDLEKDAGPIYGDL